MIYDEIKSIIFKVQPYVGVKDKAGLEAYSLSFSNFIDFIPGLFKSEPIKLLQLSYEFVYDLVLFSGKDVFTIEQILKKVVFIVLENGLWSWNLPDIVKKISDFLSKQDGVKKINLGSLHEQLFVRVEKILKNEGYNSAILIGGIVNEMIAQIEKEGSKTSIEKIIARLRHRFEQANLSNKVVDSCVNEFIELMFDEGCIFFNK